MGENNAAEILRKAGMKKTAGRVALLKLLLESEKPLSQQEISRMLKGVELNYVSIYRSLEAFCRAGITHRIETGDRTWRFAVCSCGGRGHCHPHFICNSCGAAECLRGMEIPELPAVNREYVVEATEFYLKGLCARCSSEV